MSVEPHEREQLDGARAAPRARAGVRRGASEPPSRSPPCRGAASTTFSSTVIRVSARGVWNVRHEPGPRDPVRRAPVDPLPVEERRGRTAAAGSPEMQLKSVDLPAPFGPIRPVIEPASTSRRRAVDRPHAVERAHDVAHLEPRAHSSTISSRLPRIPCGRTSTSPMITSPITISRT